MSADGPEWRFGAVPLAGGGVRFRLWAPSAGPGLRLEVEGLAPITLTCDEEGYAQTVVPDIGPGVRYRYRLADGQAFADPASRRQDGDVEDASIVADPHNHHWRHTAWQGRSWEDAVIYEAHVGLAGGYAGLRERLPELRELGVTLLELMPVGDFAGARNWGYDGVLPFAPDTVYGSPADLKALIDAAHGLGLGVMLDVVYNHFGPSGNYLPRYAAPFFRQDIGTPWGAAIDFRQPAVRAFFEENALYWLTEYRFDGLRLDAVHAIEAPDWLRELPAKLRARLPAERSVHLVIEDDLNRTHLLEQGYDAQWNDDIHHVLHHLLTGEHQGYYADYAPSLTQTPAGLLARCLAEGWAYQGQPSAYRGGAPRGEPSAHLPPTSFVCFLQNHDQIGNRARGERLTRLAPRTALRRAAIALQLLSPQIPLIFMGEEHGSRQPFYYFTGFPDAALAQAVRDGRRREFERFKDFHDNATALPDPNSVSTFKRSRPWVNSAASRRWFAYYRRLLALRRSQLTYRLRGARAESAQALGPAAVRASWTLGDGAGLCVYVNLSDQALALPDKHAPAAGWQVLFQTPHGALGKIAQGELAPDCAVWLIREA